jgi:hypothetical protein
MAEYKVTVSYWEDLTYTIEADNEEDACMIAEDRAVRDFSGPDTEAELISGEIEQEEEIEIQILGQVNLFGEDI